MKALERRIERLERATCGDADIEHALAVLAASDLVTNHPEQATDADLSLAAPTCSQEWTRAFLVALDAAGGLAAAVSDSYAPIQSQA